MPRSIYVHACTTPADMIHKIALTLAVVVASHMCIASPVPEPDPYHKTHIKVHIPHEVHTVHHHHVSKVPVFHEVPVIHEVPVVKTIPIVKTIPVPIIKHVAVEKPVFVHVSDHWGWH